MHECVCVCVRMYVCVCVCVCVYKVAVSCSPTFNDHCFRLDDVIMHDCRMNNTGSMYLSTFISIIVHIP